MEKSRTEKNVDKEDKGSTDIKAFESLIKTFFDCVQVIKVVAIPHYQTKRHFCCNLISWSWIRNSSPIALIASVNKQGGVTLVQKDTKSGSVSESADTKVHLFIKGP